MNMRMASLGLAALCFSGCSTFVPQSNQASLNIKGCSGEIWIESTFYLGRGLSGQTQASQNSWRSFVTKEVTPRFPQGFTILDARGAWANSVLKTTIYEDTKMLLILHPETKEAAQKVDDLAEAYRSAFNQQAVLTSQHRTCTTFHVAPQQNVN